MIRGWQKTEKLVALAAIVIVASTMVASEAFAQSRLCRQLEAQLANASAGNQSPQFRKYDRAVKTQSQQIRKAERRARRAGCKTNRGISIFGTRGNRAECRSLVSTIDRMERNLAQLERRRDRYDRSGSRADRARILAKIEANGCREEQRVARTTEDRRRTRLNILDQIFNGESEVPRRRAPLDDEYGNRIRTLLNGEGGLTVDGLTGNYRTLCVRTCDGYFFPVSFAASEVQLDRDRRACEAMCPGTEVQLYYHKVPDEESEDMISLAGEPYTALPTAFRYRQAGYKREKSCGCSPAKDFSIIAGNPKPEEAQEEIAYIPYPTARPDPASDPETLMNRDGGLDAASIRRILTPAPTAEDTTGPDGRKVRVVGPVFLPDPEGAIDLQARARKSAQ